jgi:hypothetical protein
MATRDNVRLGWRPAALGRQVRLVQWAPVYLTMCLTGALVSAELTLLLTLGFAMLFRAAFP